MSSKKQTASASNKSAKGNANSSSFTIQGSQPAKSRKAPKPTQEWVEVDSDEEENALAPPKRGVLRGLDPNNVLATPSTRSTVEISDSDKEDDESDENNVRRTQQPAHSTRASRHGKADVNYDMKYHPMDEVTRPKRTANRRSGSRSKSASMKPDLDQETSDESEPSSAPDGGAEEADEIEDDDVEVDAHVPTTRAPDLRASRHSARSEAQKAVNYSRSHHPQDYGLPGYQHKAKQSRDSSVRKKPNTSYKRKSIAEDGDNNDRDEEEEGNPKTHVKPRKKLKSLSSSSPTTIKSKAKSAKSRRKHTEAEELKTFDTDELTELVEELCKDAPSGRPLAQAEDGSNDEEEDADSWSKDSAALAVVNGVCDDQPFDATSSSRPVRTSGTFEAVTHGDASSPSAAVCHEVVGDICERTCAAKHASGEDVNEDHHSPAIATGDIEAYKLQVQNAQQPPTPTSEDRLVIVRPYLTGYEPTILSLAPGQDFKEQYAATELPVHDHESRSHPQKSDDSYTDALLASSDDLRPTPGTVMGAEGTADSRVKAVESSSPAPESPSSQGNPVLSGTASPQQNSAASDAASRSEEPLLTEPVYSGSRSSDSTDTVDRALNGVRDALGTSESASMSASNAGA
ncbi:hypothetical protein LTR85_005305 [Meristemomyces frigidus]|nr:hypothetical protein LTR85_005305 [Meristemomyces frigidus]